MLGLGTQEPRAIREAKAEAWTQAEAKGREEEARSLVLRLLNRRLRKIPKQLLAKIEKLSLVQTEALGEALLDFTTVTDLKTWLHDQ